MYKILQWNVHNSGSFRGNEAELAEMLIHYHGELQGFPLSHGSFVPFKTVARHVFKYRYGGGGTEVVRPPPRRHYLLNFCALYVLYNNRV